MLKSIISSLLVAGIACAAESFEALPGGELTAAAIEFGSLKAEPGHVQILNQHARTGKKALRLMGGDKKTLRLQFNKIPEVDAQVSFWAQRWTRDGASDLKVVAETPKGDIPLTELKKIRVGGYQDQVMLVVPAGTRGLRLVSSSVEQGGMLVDDMEMYCGPMVVTSAQVGESAVMPMLKQAPINPVMSYNVTTAGAASPVAVECLKLKIYPADAVDSVTLRTSNYDRSVDGTDGMKFSKSKVYGKARPAADGSVTVICSGNLEPGKNVLWVDARPSAKARVGSMVTIESCGLQVGGKVYGDKAAPVVQRVGTLVAVPDAEVVNPTRQNEIRSCKTYRIPGLIRTKAGTLLGCFDARYLNHLDLSSDIDVAVVRSEDGGQTWSAPVVAMDAGPGKGNGCGDPCILQDKETGRIWIQALATHFDRNPCLLRSRPGFEPQDTGQWEMVYSDDDGKTWSSNINITREIKQYRWTTILAGPGCGIYTSNGYIVFPAQIWDFSARPVSMSTICYSADHGKTWHYGNGVPHRTSECQVVELADGALMLSCRNETFQGKRAIFVTRDFGKTWQPHETNTNTLNDPACQASLISVEHPQHGRLLLYSHPNSRPKGRNTMSIRVSRDDGKTWSEGYEYDSRECWGYSCLAMVDDENVGLFYEPSHVSETNDYHGIGFLSIPLETIMSGKTEPAPAPEK